MTRKKIGKIGVLAVLLLLNLTGYAQEKEINEITKTLQDELNKADVSIERSAIRLTKISQNDLGKYDLTGKPGDAFYIKVNNQLIDVRSESVNGLRNGVYWYLKQLGFRYYFPGEIWQHIPRLQTAFKPVEKTVAPSFSHRRIWYAYGTGSKQADNDYNKWFEANLLGGDQVSAGHSYDGIVNRNKAVFLQHPEYFAQKVAKGKTPPDPKFEPGNEELVQLVIRDAFAQIESGIKNSGRPPAMISMDPSDGGGFSTSASALKIGGPSEQAFYLANRVAKAVRGKYPGVKIGLYAYNLHAAPPRFELEPNLVVLVATSMNQSAYRTDELIEMWKRKGVDVGIRDYYGVMAWDWDMPGQPAGSKLSFINKLKEFYKKGVRYFTAETNVGWISRGVGHYAASQLLWDVETNTEEIKSAFFKNMYGRGGADMEKLFQAWQTYKEAIPLDGDLYQWGQWLEDASKMESDRKIQQRIDYVKQYLHYVYLFKQWKSKNTDANLVQLLNYAYRVQDEGIVASYPLFRRIANSAVAGKKNMRFDDPKAVWKQNNKELTHEETTKNFYADRGLMKQSEKSVRDVLPEQFKITTATKSNNAVKSKPKTSSTIRLRGGHTIVFHLQKNDASINLSTGLIKAHQYKKLRLSIYPYKSDLGTGNSALLLSEEILPKQPVKSISLKALQPGSYMAVIDDAGGGFTVGFTGAVSYGVVAGTQNKMWTLGRNNLAFAVEDKNEFQVNNSGSLTLVSPTGRIIDLQKKKGLITIQVNKGEKGAWKIRNQSGVFYLQGVVPFVSADPEFLLRNDE